MVMVVVVAAAGNNCGLNDNFEDTQERTRETERNIKITYFWFVRVLYDDEHKVHT